MNPCPKCMSPMKSILTKAGVVIDKCKSCKSVWLDRGEINFFVKDKRSLSNYESNGLRDVRETEYNCPTCYIPLYAGKMPSHRFEVEECKKCKGMFIEYHELQKVIDAGDFKKIRTDKKVSLGERKSSRKIKVPPIQLPSLAFTSGAVLFSLYGVLIGTVLFIVESGYIPYNLGILSVVGVVFLQFLFAPIVMDWSLRILGSLSWYDPGALPVSFRKSLMSLCIDNDLPIPKIGIIKDGTPQAYTYGRTPWSARVVLSEGLFEILDDEEVKAVLAHELGHIKHWDFVVMTVAQLVPIVLYQIYRVCDDLMTSSRSRRSEKKQQGLVVAAAIAYIAYMISEYLVKFISRLREYHADKFSCYATRNPNALLTALIKIGFGVVKNKEDSNKQKRMAFNRWGL